MDETDLPLCAYQLHAGTQELPPEHCEERAEPGEDFCLGHLCDENPWTDLDADRARDEAYEWEAMQ